MANDPEKPGELTDFARPEEPPRSKPKPVLYIKLTGDRISLDRVSLSVLSRTFEAVGVLSSLGEPHPKPTAGESSDPGSFQLVGAKAGSAIYSFAGRTNGLQRLNEIGRTLKRPEEAQSIDFSLAAIEKLSSVSARLKCRITVVGRLDGEQFAVLARIGPDTFRQLKAALFIKGETSICGTVKRVGGVTRKSCSIRLPSRDELLYCRVQGEELSRKLGRYLYQDVVVSGEATWLRPNWSLVGFMIRSVSQPKQGNPIEAFDAVREAGGGAWDAIDDPEAYLGYDRGE